VNNLYSYAMRQLLLTEDFKFLSRDEIVRLDIDSVDDEAATGYILEVDLRYPSNLHDKYNDYPLASERLKTSPEMLSPYRCLARHCAKLAQCRSSTSSGIRARPIVGRGCFES
jgi:hypothetical protein